MVVNSNYTTLTRLIILFVSVIFCKFVVFPVNYITYIWNIYFIQLFFFGACSLFTLHSLFLLLDMLSLFLYIGVLTISKCYGEITLPYFFFTLQKHYIKVYLFHQDLFLCLHNITLL